MFFFQGFYTLDPKSLPEKPSLILGPFQGKVACQTISFSRGVCGAAAATGQTQLVHDVESFPGHIACDSESKSELVVPIIVEGKGAATATTAAGNGVVGIIDVDCAVLNGFDEVDKLYLEKLAELIGKSSDWP